MTRHRSSGSPSSRPARSRRSSSSSSRSAIWSPAIPSNRQKRARAARLLVPLLAFGCGAAEERAGVPAATAAEPRGEAPVGALASGGGVSFASFSHSCAAVDGSLQCWGADEAGQLGDGRVGARVPLPVRVAGLEGAPGALAAGRSHTCAVLAGALHCWGSNAAAQLAVDEPHLVPAPRAVAGLPAPVTAVAAGDDQTCAVAAEQLFCWGRDRSGILGAAGRAGCPGRPRLGPCSESPVRVALGGSVSAVSLGPTSGCALADGAAWCWGENDRGQLGDGTRESRGAPVRVAGLPGPVSALSVGGAHACAVAGGGVWCWGANDRGQLGDGATADRARPVRAAIEGAVAVAAGAGHSCAVAGGRAHCWGDAREGQLGAAPDAAAHARPAPVPGLPAGVGAVAAGVDQACAAAGRAVWCWGDNDFGQLGSGDGPRDHAGPVRVAAWDDGRLRDRDGDGRLVVACLGDSNTHPTAERPVSWCALLGDALPEGWVAVNRAVGGATAVSRDSLLRAEDHLEYALESDAPDVVLLAYGTNDLLQGATPEEVVLAYARLRQRAREAGVESFVATTPPVWPPSAPVNERIDALNALLRDALPPSRLVDFAEGVARGDFVDALHFNEAGHARRARAAAAALAAAGPRP